jgi:hypothetical protein
MCSEFRVTSTGNDVIARSGNKRGSMIFHVKVLDILNVTPHGDVNEVQAYELEVQHIDDLPGNTIALHKSITFQEWLCGTNEGIDTTIRNRRDSQVLKEGRKRTIHAISGYAAYRPEDVESCTLRKTDENHRSTLALSINLKHRQTPAFLLRFNSFKTVSPIRTCELW